MGSNHPSTAEPSAQSISRVTLSDGVRESVTVRDESHDLRLMHATADNNVSDADRQSE